MRARVVVTLWFRRHSTDVNRWRSEAATAIGSAAQSENHGFLAGQAAQAYSDRLFQACQVHLSKKVRPCEVYAVALSILARAIKRRVRNLAIKTLGRHPRAEWMAMYDVRMQRMVEYYKPQVLTLFHSDVGLVVSATQIFEATIGGEEPGVRILPRPPAFREFVLEKVRQRGFRSLRELARQSQISPTIIHKLMKGGRVSNTTLSVLADVLAIPSAEFIDIVQKHWAALEVDKK